MTQPVHPKPQNHLPHLDPKAALKRLGPGLITGAADDDPGGIATYSQAGAQFGLGLAWTIPLTLPCLAIVQMVAARIGRVTGRGIIANLKQDMSGRLTLAVVLMLMLANTINIAANLLAMSDAMTLTAGGSGLWWMIGLGGFCVVSQVFVPYHLYVRFLKWATLSLFCYVATIMTIQVDWGDVLSSLILPRIEWSGAYLVGIVAVFGTTISPYLIFWQAAEEVEEMRLRASGRSLHGRMFVSKREFARIRLDTWVGILFAHAIELCILVTAAVTLHTHGITEIESSAQAAEALRPIAGDFAFMAFAAGIVGTGLLSIPVLAGSSAYAIGDALGRPVGLERKPAEAPLFYGVIAASILAGVGLHFMPVDPIRALYLSAVLNGILVVPLIFVTVFVARDPKIMGKYRISKGEMMGGYAVAGIMGAAALAMLATL